MLTRRDEYGHYIGQKSRPIISGQHIEPSPHISGGIPLDYAFTRREKDDTQDYIRHLRNEYELSGSLEFY